MRLDARQEAAAFLESMEEDAEGVAGDSRLYMSAHCLYQRSVSKRMICAGSVNTGKRKSASTGGLLEGSGKKKKTRKTLQMEAMLQQEAAGS